MMKIWITADTHFSHKNIIRYCDRPFADVEEMNNTIVKNWNDTVAKEDIIYFLGDLCFGDQELWLNKLNGRIQWIRGNHDKSFGMGRHYKFLPIFAVLKYANCSIVLIHNSDDECIKTIDDPNMWIISGHHHNKRPLFDEDRRRINVSMEMTEYKPVLLSSLTSLILRSKTQQVADMGKDML